MNHLNSFSIVGKLAYVGRDIHYNQMFDVKNRWYIRNEMWISTEPFACDDTLNLLCSEEVPDYVYEIENVL